MAQGWSTAGEGGWDKCGNIEIQLLTKYRHVLGVCIGDDYVILGNAEKPKQMNVRMFKSSYCLYYMDMFWVG